ncbi:MAG: hypothetical protein NC912_01540 [Candidatus Omnitrophica bacterium]|nr:hypothetical protein [Candidatus Omnitrophota bacterium]
MGKKKVFIFTLIFIFILFLGFNFAEEIKPEIQKKKDASSFVSDFDVQWVWGEVVSVDTNTKTIILKYLDYETDVEKEIILNTDENTQYENCDSLNQIKPADTISVDYIISPEGKNLAKYVVLEKPENTVNPQEESKEVLPEGSDLR